MNNGAIIDGKKIMKINWYAILIIGVWLSSAIAEFATKDGSCMFFAFITTICIGIGYIVTLMF